MSKTNSYGVYIIHEKKKAGLAKDIDERLAKQGYTRNDATVEVFVEGVSDLSLARQIEKDVQKSLGYTDYEDKPDIVDTFLKRKGLNKKSKTSSSPATTGFRCQVEDIADFIADDIIILDTPKEGELVFDTPKKKQWIIENINKSKFDGELACYVYNKAAANFLNNFKHEQPISTGRVDRLLADIHSWADNRGILKGKIETQTLKLGEEFGELQKAVLKNRSEDIKDAIGDIIVVLVSIAHFNGHSVADALQMAYDTISKRTGYTNEKGDFIKTHYNGKEIIDTL